MDTPTHPAFVEALRHFRSQADMARRLGVTAQAVAHFKRHGFPARRAVQLEQMLGGKVRAVELMGQRGEVAVQSLG